MQIKKNRPLVLLGLMLAWILFVLGGYYYYHKPINIEMIAAPLSAGLDILFLLLFAGLAGGLGRRLLRAGEMPALERAALQFALGAGLLSLLWLLLGALGLYRFPLAAPLLILGWIFLLRDVRGWYRDLGTLKEAWQRSSGFEKLLAGLACILLIYQLFIALAPPIKWDALAYHLQLPRQFLAAGKLIFTPENPYWGQSQVGEMLYTFAMSFHRVETASVTGWLVGVMFLIGLFGLASSQAAGMTSGETAPVPAGGLNYAAGWAAVTAVLAGYTFRYLLGWSYTDLFTALFGLAAIQVFFAWLDTRRSSWLLWAGLFCGFAAGVKWTAGVLPVGIFAAALVFGRQRGLKLKTWLLAGIIAFLAITPWLVKNAVATGSPLYPYLANTSWMSAARIASANPHPDLAKIDWLLRLFLPVTTTWAGVDSAGGFGADIGPLLLLFALPGFWLYRRSPKAQTLAIILVPTALGLGVGSLINEHLLQTRLYYVALPCLALPCGWGWAWLQCQVLQGVRLRRILGAVVLLVMGLVFWQDSYFMGQYTPERFSLGTQTGQSYLENTLGYHIQAAQALESLPPSARALVLWDPRGLYLPLNAQADLWIDRWRTDRRELQTAPAILEHWRSQGFTHLLVYQPGVDLIRPAAGQPPTADWTVLQDLLARLPAPVRIGDTYLLYSLS